MSLTGARAARLLLGAYLVVAAALVVVAQVADRERPASGAAYTEVALLSAAAVVAGVLVRRPAPAWPGWCLAGCLLLVSLADGLDAWYLALGREPLLSPADGLRLASYVPLLLAALGLGARSRPRPVLLDAAAVAVAVALPLCVYVAGPALAPGTLPARLVGLAYPLCDLVVLVAVAGVLLGGGTRRGAWLLALGLVATLAGDIGVAVQSASGTYVGGSAVDLGRCLGLALWTAVVLAPGTRGTSGAYTVLGGWWLALLTGLTATAPLSLLLTPAPGRADVLAVTAGAVLLALLVLLRLSGVARALRRALAREQEQAHTAQAVASAGGLLLSGVHRSDVQRAALAAVLQLLPPGRAAVGIALGPVQLLELVAVDGRGLEPQEVAAVDLDVLDADDRRTLAAGREVVRDVSEHDRVLVLPLASAGREVGVVVVAAPTLHLEQAHSRLRLIAPALALALESSRLREAAGRRRAPRTPCRPPAGTGSPMAADIARGLREHEFVVHYQPIVGLRDGRARGFEALVRWQHPERGLLMPGSFLPQVEESGMLGQLDAAVLSTACRHAAAWDRSPAGPYVSVNVSTEQLVDVGFAVQVQQALAAAGLPPWRLLVEVTETAAVADFAAVAAVLGRLRARRVRVAFDDFGTGYSSLSWLQQLPLDVVKIDKSFVDRLPQRDGERPVVEALVRLAQTMGLDVVAEGVEREEQRAALAVMGVTLAQGWLFSRALPPEGVAAVLPGRAVRSPPRDDRQRLALSS